MTDEQFEKILTGASIAHGEKLHRLGSLLNSVAAVANDPSKFNVDDLVSWAELISQDVITSHNKRKSEAA